MWWNSSEYQTKHKIGYWVATGLIAFAMGAGGAADVMQSPDIVKSIVHLGYPLYFMTMLGASKIAGAIAILLPGTGRLKEWAYAGITIDLLAASVSHAAVGDGAKEIGIPIVLLAVMCASYLLRPADRVVGASS